ncbi:hypothetical protein B0I72DRAFT_142308 [Yarrowia lipolytica]|jgi:hypothetical protein|nr:hypothetical protein B0I72DRAFT_142308 [Yarrowia lipolytica]VBB87756.1 Hypothetical protein conserved in the Yarrowia clade [Yarrowia lipolytica]
MRKGLSSQHVDSHPNRTELELLFVPPERDSDDGFEIKYPYPDESPYLETYDYPRPYAGTYPEFYAYPNDLSGENYPGYLGGNGYPYNLDTNGYVCLDDYPYRASGQLEGEIHVSTTVEPPSGFSTVYSPEHPRKAARLPLGIMDVHPPPVNRVLTPHHVAAWKRDKHPISTAESSIGDIPNHHRYTLEEEQQILYEGLCEQLLRQRALLGKFQDKSDTGSMNHLSRMTQPESAHPSHPTPACRLSQLSVHFGDGSALDENHQFAQPTSKFSSVSDGLYLPNDIKDMSRYSIDSINSDKCRHFASVQDSIRVAVNRGIEGRFGMVYSGDARGSPHVYSGSPPIYETSPRDFHGSSRDCMFWQIRNRVSSTATLFKRVVSRPFRHKVPKVDDERPLEWRAVSSRGKRGVSRLFRRSSSTQWVSLNASDPGFVARSDGSMRCGGYGWWNRKLNSGVPTFL